LIERSVACPLFFFVVPLSLSLPNVTARSLVLDLLDLTLDRAAAFPPGFFPSFTSTPFRGAPAMAPIGVTIPIIAQIPKATVRPRIVMLIVYPPYFPNSNSAILGCPEWLMPAMTTRFQKYAGENINIGYVIANMVTLFGGSQ
jgi:hypothetical protein